MRRSSFLFCGLFVAVIFIVAVAAAANVVAARSGVLLLGRNSSPEDKKKASNDVHPAGQPYTFFLLLFLRDKVVDATSRLLKVFWNPGTAGADTGAIDRDFRKSSESWVSSTGPAYLGPLHLRSAFPDFLYDDPQRHYRHGRRSGRKDRHSSSSSCVPHLLHLAQRDNVAMTSDVNRDETNRTRTMVVSMTLSFALDFEDCAPSRIARIVVEYGTVNNNQNNSGIQGFNDGKRDSASRRGSSNDDGDDSDAFDFDDDEQEYEYGTGENTKGMKSVVVVPRRQEESNTIQKHDERHAANKTSSITKNTTTATASKRSSYLSSRVLQQPPVQFDYETREMRWRDRVFHSDWWYHVPLSNVKAGRHLYWYRIRVVTVQQSRNPSTASSSLELDKISPRQPTTAVAAATTRVGRLGTEANVKAASLRRRRRQQADKGALLSSKQLDVAAASASGVVAGAAATRMKHRYFVSPPAPGMPTRLALVGDLGQTYYSTLTMLHIWQQTAQPKQGFTTNATSSRRSLEYQQQQQQHQHRAKAGGGGNDGPNEEDTDHNVPVTNVIIAGDMSYADSDPHRWTSWLDLMEPLMRSVPTHVAPGNHEIECDYQGNLFEFYENYFVNPNRVHDPHKRPYRPNSWNDWWRGCSTPSHFQYQYDYGNAFYSYRHGLATIVVLSSYSQSGVNSTQYRWLENELVNEYNRNDTPWLLVVFHAPLYTTFLGHQNEAPATVMRESMEDLFVEHGVNLVVSGHDHAYLRTHPMYRGKRQLDGMAPIYWTLGAGGNREGHSAGYIRSDPEPWVAQRSLADFGFGGLFLPNATHARLTWTRDGVGLGDPREMAVDDDAWIVNPHV